MQKKTVQIVQLVLCGTFFLAYSAVGQDRKDATPITLEAMQSKIQKRLQSDRWSDASRVLVTTVWEDFKTTVASQQVAMQADGGQRQEPWIEGYLGRYRLDQIQEKIHLERQNASLTVVLKGRSFPAVVLNDSVVFTTGDVVNLNSIPMLGKLPHASLEWFAIKRSGNELTFGTTDPSGPKMKMTKIESN